MSGGADVQGANVCCTLSGVVDKLHVDAGLGEHVDRLQVPVLGSPHRRRAPGDISGVGVGAELEQVRQQCVVVARGRQPEHRLVVGRVSVVQQPRHTLPDRRLIVGHYTVIASPLLGPLARVGVVTQRKRDGLASERSRLRFK